MKKQLLIFAIVGLMLSLGAGPLLAQTTATDTTTTTTKKSTKKAKTDAATTDTTKTTTTKATADTTKPATPAATTAAAPAPAAPAAKPAATKAATASAATAGPPPQKGMVWVNTDSGVYHKEGTRYYGKTKQGKYMTEADAQKAGYKPSKSGN